MIEWLKRLPLAPLILLLLSFASLIWGVQSQKDMGPVPAYFVHIASYPLKLTDRLADTTLRSWRRYVYLVHLSGDYEKLLRDNERLLQRVHALEEYALENRRLRELLDFKKRTKLRLLPARVIAMPDPGEPTKVIVIDKGSFDGIEKNRAVVTAQGVVGRTWSVGPTSARVLLLTDTRSAVSSLLQRTRERGIVWGTGFSDRLRMQRVRSVLGLEAGEAVVTSGLGGVYPKGLMVGRVKAVSDMSDQLFEYLDLTPGMDFSKLEEVLIVLKRKDAKRPPLQP